MKPKLFDVPTLQVLPRIYRLLLTLSRRHGLNTLARVHHRRFRRGQIVPLPGGGRLFIPPNRHYFGFLAGVHEGHVRRLIDRCLKPGDISFDVGANIGYFAMMMADRVGKLGKVIAFEPVTETYGALSMNANLARDDGLTILPVLAAVSSKEGELTICRHEYSTHNQVSAALEVTQKGAERVRATTLVGEFEKLGADVAINFLKVDVEGHELSVVEGGRPLFQRGRIRRMVIEVTPGDDAAAIDRVLRDCGATMRCWLDGRWSIAPLDRLPLRTDVFVEFPF